MRTQRHRYVHIRFVIALAGDAKTNGTTAAAKVSAAIPVRAFNGLSVMIFLRRLWKILALTTSLPRSRRLRNPDQLRRRERYRQNSSLIRCLRRPRRSPWHPRPESGGGNAPSLRRWQLAPRGLERRVFNFEPTLLILQIVDAGAEPCILGGAQRSSLAAVRAARAAMLPRRQAAWPRILVVRCSLPCDPPVGGHSLQWRNDTTLLSRSVD